MPKLRKVLTVHTNLFDAGEVMAILAASVVAWCVLELLGWNDTDRWQFYAFIGPYGLGAALLFYWGRSRITKQRG